MAALGLSSSTQDLCCGMRDLSLWCADFSLVVAHSLCSCSTWALYLQQAGLVGDQTRVPCIRRQILNHWTTREVPPNEF